MSALFIASAVIAVFAAAMVVTRTNAMHALLFLILMLLSIASVFWTMGAPFVAVLQIILYAGAILVLFVFAVMILNLGEAEQQSERSRLSGAIWVIPVVLALGLLAVFLGGVISGRGGRAVVAVLPKLVGINLYTFYLIGVELASVLLLAALIAAYHFGAFMSRARTEDE